MNAKSISLVVIGVLIGAIGFLSFQLYMPAGPTGSAIANQNQGFSSYEEMMAAHHGPQSSGGGCGFSEEGVPSSSKVGGVSEYGISYDQKGYDELLKYAVLSLDATQTSKVVGLDVSIPCCGFSKLQASGNCECGHHTALFGLAKLLASKGYEKQAIQSEIDRWKEIFYPNGAAGTGGC